MMHNIPIEKRVIIEELVSSLSHVSGVQAIVLGGSYARGTAKQDSDIDLGLYYMDNAPLDLSHLRKILTIYVREDNLITVTTFYEWGAWVNGGAWLETQSGKVDLLYRNVGQLNRVIQDSIEGKYSCDVLQQPPFGFYSVTYLGETKTCIPLYDPEHILQRLKEKVVIYPENLRRAIIQDNLWSVEFTLLYAKKCALACDIYSTMGCATRILACLTQVLFALNREYFISDREAINAIEHLALRPNEYQNQIETLFSHLNSRHLTKGYEDLETMFHAVCLLANGLYQPKYSL